jgi:hypothetical protein
MANAILQPSNGLARMRKRFLIVSVAALAVLGTSLGVSFTADTGVTQITATTPGSDLPLVWSADYAIGAGNGGLPLAIAGNAMAGWMHGATIASPVVNSRPTAPGWGTVTTNVAGTIATSGDIAVVDATTSTANFLLVTVYITNMHELSQTYNSYALPIRVYAGTGSASSGATINWGATPAPITDSNLLNTANSYLTNNAGYETFKLATGSNKYYEITLDAGGSYFPYQATPNGVSNTPALYITAQRTS